MMRSPARGPAGAAVAGCGVAVTVGEYLLLGGSTGAAAFALAGLLGSVVALAGRAAGATLVGGAMIGQFALSAHPGTAAALETAALLAVLLVVAEAAASERWRTGGLGLARAFAVPAVLGVAVTAASVVIADSGEGSTLPAVPFAVIAIVAAAAAIAVAFARQRPPARRD